MYKLIIGILLILGACRLSESNYNDLQSDNTLEARQLRGEIIDDNNDNVHDLTCRCGYCVEGDEDLSRHRSWEEFGVNECDTLIFDETWKVGEDNRNLVFTYNDAGRAILSKHGGVVDDFYTEDSDRITWYQLPSNINANELFNDLN